MLIYFKSGLFDCFQLMQNLGKLDKTKDEKFEIYVNNFNKQQTAANKLQKELKKYVQALKGMTSSTSTPVRHIVVETSLSVYRKSVWGWTIFLVNRWRFWVIQAMFNRIEIKCFLPDIDLKWVHYHSLSWSPRQLECIQPQCCEGKWPLRGHNMTRFKSVLYPKEII